MTRGQGIVENLDARRVEVSEIIDGQWVSVYSQLTEKPTIEIVCYVNGITIERSEPPAAANLPEAPATAPEDKKET